MSIETKETNNRSDLIERDSEDHQNTADITDGGLIGAVGGGIVGALAGGPLGAVIGAVIGGGASAAAINYTEHHEPKIAHGNYRPGEGITDEAAIPQGEDVAEEWTNSDDQSVLIIEESPIFVAIIGTDIEQEIRLRAYQLWEQRGHRNNLAVEDWLDAELEVLGEREDFGTVDSLNNPEVLEETVGYAS